MEQSVTWRALHTSNNQLDAVWELPRSQELGSLGFTRFDRGSGAGRGSLHFPPTVQHRAYEVGILLGKLPMMLARLGAFGPIGGHKFLRGPAGAKVEFAFHRTSPHEMRGLVYGRPAAHRRRGSTAPGTDPHPFPVASVFLRCEN